MGSKMLFGWLLNRFWEVSDLFWTLSGTFGRFFFGLQNRTFIKHWSNMGSKRPFKSILDRFWYSRNKWICFRCSKPNFNKALVQNEFQKTFRIDLGSILGGFWAGWGGFGKLLGRFGLSKLKPLRHMVVSWAHCVSSAASHFATGTPASHRFASRSVTIRGGSDPRRVLNKL